MTTLEQVRGDTGEWDVTEIRDATDALITTGQVRLTVKAGLDETDEPTAIVNVVAPIVAGAAHITVPPSETLQLTANRTRWLSFDLQVEVGAGRWTLFRGTFIVRPQIAVT